MERLVVAVDGPAGAGKSTIAKIVAKRLGILYIDTGAMYRAVTLKILRGGINIDDNMSICNMLEDTNIELDGSSVYLDGEDVTEVIRTEYVSSKVSAVSALGCVRESLTHLQRQMANKVSVIMDGRDIGTNVLKDANVKIYLTASVEERAKRRYGEMVKKGYDVEIDAIAKEIASRDRQDSERKINPLRKAEDAITVDTTGKSINEVVEEILYIAKRR